MLRINRFVGVALAAGVLYALFFWTIASESPVANAFRQRLPGWSWWLLVTAIGPGIFLDPLEGDWRLFVTSMTMIVACLAGALYSWRQRSRSKLSIALLLIAIAVWACCGWVAVLVFPPDYGHSIPLIPM